MGNRLRRTSLLPATAEAPEVAPVTEPYAFASLSSDLLLRVARDTGRSDDAGGLLCRKGEASASRWRSYDHKDAFEPAQAATAPPSDAEEMGSWQKYDSAPPAPKGPAKTVSEDELPTSWSKYETKPIASLLGSIESRRAKLQVTPAAESVAPTPPAVPAAPAVVETAPELVPPKASLVPKPTLVVEMPATEVKLAAEIEIEAPAPVADPVVMAGPAAEIAPAVEPTAALPELPLPEIDSPATTVAEDDEPEFPTTAAPAPAELERSEPAVPPEYPTLALAPPDEQSPVLAEATAREILAVATDERRSDEPVTVPELTKFAKRTNDTVQEGPSVASAAPAPASDAAPLPLQEPAAATSALAIKSAIPGKRAMLARLAEMLEQALSAKRSRTVDAAPPIVSVDEPASGPESPVAIAPVAASDLSPVISEEHPAATIDVVEAAAPAADPAAIVEPEVSVAAAQETLIELVAPQDDRDHGAEIETGAEASIEAVTPPPAEPEAIDPIVDEPPIEPEALLATSPEPDVELPAPSLDAIEISEPPAVVGVPSSELSAPLEASNEIVDPAVDLSRVDEPETGTKSTVAVAAETELSADPIEQPEPRAPQPDLPPEVAEVRKPDSVRKATLARLAEMLQRALSARPASAAVEPRTPPEPTPVIAPSIAENVASLATEAQMPATEIPVEPLAMEAPLALAEPPEIAELASVADEATAPEPVAASEKPHVGSDFPSSEFTMLEADLSFESAPETPPLHERVHLKEFHEPEAAVADEALQDETAATLVLSGEVAGPPADGLDPEEPAATAAPPSLENDAATADAPTEPTLEAVADPALPEMQPEGDDSAIAEESTEAVTLDDVSTPVDETPTQAIATALDAETAPPDEAHDESERVRAPAPSIDATSVALEPAAPEPEILDAVDAPPLAASSPMIEAPIIVTAEVSAEHMDDADALFETARPAQAQEVPDPVSVPTPTLDATPVAAEHGTLEPEISYAVAASAPAASEPTIETLEPMIIAAQASPEPIADVAAPLETLLEEQERAAAEPVPAPPPSSDDAPIAPQFSTQEPESSDAVELPLLVASSPTIETPEPIIVAAAAPAELVVGVLVPVEPAAPEILPAPEAALAAPTPPRLTPAQREKEARAALTDDLADVIHNVLSTTHFASRAMKPKRYNEEEPQTNEPELTDLGEELAASLPHPVAIPPRFGRMERGIAFVSVAMMIAGGYFAFSLWHGAGSPSAQAAAPRPAIVIAKPHSEDWGERARDMTRELGSMAVVRDAPSAQPPEAGANAGARP